MLSDMCGMEMSSLFPNLRRPLRGNARRRSCPLAPSDGVQEFPPPPQKRDGWEGLRKRSYAGKVAELAPPLPSDMVKSKSTSFHRTRGNPKAKQNRAAKNKGNATAAA